MSSKAYSNPMNAAAKSSPLSGQRDAGAPRVRAAGDARRLHAYKRMLKECHFLIACDSLVWGCERLGHDWCGRLRGSRKDKDCGVIIYENNKPIFSFWGSVTVDTLHSSALLSQISERIMSSYET